jgi:hemerythrin superfamily protein
MTSQSSIKKDIVSVITSDHVEVKQLHEQFKSSGDEAHKEKIVHEIIKLLSVHGACEEMVFYPAIAKNVKAKGEDLANHSLKEHRELKKDLYDLDQMKIKDPQFETQLQKVMSDFYHHVEEEETQVLSSLAGSVTAEELIKLGESFINHKSVAPTRPHPDAPDTYPTNVPINVGTKPLDAMRDAARERADEKAQQQQSSSSTATTPPTA